MDRNFLAEVFLEIVNLLWVIYPKILLKKNVHSQVGKLFHSRSGRVHLGCKNVNMSQFVILVAQTMPIFF